MGKIDKFIQCVKDYNLIEIFNDCEIYLWSNFPFNATKDIDIILIGEPTNSLGKRVKDFKEYCVGKCMTIDIQVFKDTKVFAGIEEYNRTGDMNLSNIEKYKLEEHPSNRIYRERPRKINDYFWEFKLQGVNNKYKWRYGKLNLHYPIEIKDFIKLVFNIKNPDIYNIPGKDKDIITRDNMQKEFLHEMRKGNMDSDKLKEQLKIDEGVVYEIYNDHLGYPTFGIGHLVLERDGEHGLPVGTPVSEDRVNECFLQDLQNVIHDCKKLHDGWDGYPEEVKQVVANMMFNMGLTRLSKFNKHNAALQCGDWKGAAIEGRDSRWYKQVTNRAERLMKRLEEI